MRILAVDDDPFILELLKEIIGHIGDHTLETVESGPEALDRINKAKRFDCIMLDYQMPGMNGVEGLGKALEKNQGKPTGLLTSDPTAQVVTEILAMGSSGVILKTASLKDLANEIRFMTAGGRYVPVELLDLQRLKSRGTTKSPLSEREMQVLEHLAEGQSNREIAQGLSLAEATVKMHVKSICTKLGANNRTQAVIVAQDRNYI